MKLPLFPLSAHIFPEGRLSLRVFEPRYLRMVKEVCQSGQGLVICMMDEASDKTTNQHILPVGTWVEICDFSQLEDGLLGIVVKGKAFVSISDIETEQDGLRLGHCELLTQEESTDVQAHHDIAVLSKRLQELFGIYPELGQLYEGEAKFECPRWVLYRWMEVLPISPEQKQDFIQSKSLNEVYHYLHQLVQ